MMLGGTTASNEVTGIEHNIMRSSVIVTGYNSWTSGNALSTIYLIELD